MRRASPVSLRDTDGVSRSTNVTLAPIAAEDLPEVGRFLYEHLDPGLSGEQWAAALTPTWSTQSPTHGYLMRSAGGSAGVAETAAEGEGVSGSAEPTDRIVGVYAAFYSEQSLPDGGVRRVCNLAAWCVLEEFRPHSLLLARAMLRQRDRELTDMSPSGAVVATNERLGFAHLDTSGALVLNLPLTRGPRGARLVRDLDEIAGLLQGADLRAFGDHRHSPAVRHLAIVRGDRVCWVVTRTVRRKRLPLFAAIVHVSDRDLFGEAAGLVYRDLLLRGGRPFTLVETRVTGSVPWHARRLEAQRPKMYLSRSGAGPDSVTQLYSELTQVRW